MNLTLIALSLAAVLGAPSISAVTPRPVTLGGIAEITGAGFAAGATTVTIGAIAQDVVNVQPDRVRIVVDPATPLGAQSLTVTSDGGQAQLEVEVAPPAPKITTVTPEPLVLGAAASVLGEALAGVTAVSVGGVDASITQQTPVLLGFTVPWDAALLGSRQLLLDSPSGQAARTVNVGPPTPVISAIAPNPARIGDLVTLRGILLPINVTARIGAADAPVVGVVSGAVTVHVTDEVAIGPHDVTVQVGSLSSAPAGPLYIQAGASDRPEVYGAYPLNVARGGTLWVVGAHLDTITGATHGLEVLSCDKRACRLGTTDALVGEPLTAAVTGPQGAAVFRMQVTEDVLLVPTITSAEPAPALRGRTLTVHGQGLQGTRAVVIGGRSQSINFFDATTVTFVVHAETPLGAQQLFVAGTGGSDPFELTVLDPAPIADDDPDASADADADADDTAAPPKKKDDGCASGGGGAGAAWLALVTALALATASARRRRPRRASCPHPRWPPSA